MAWTRALNLSSSSSTKQPQICLHRQCGRAASPDIPCSTTSWSSCPMVTLLDWLDFIELCIWRAASKSKCAGKLQAHEKICNLHALQPLLKVGLINTSGCQPPQTDFTLTGLLLNSLLLERLHFLKFEKQALSTFAYYTKTRQSASSVQCCPPFLALRPPSPHFVTKLPLRNIYKKTAVTRGERWPCPALNCPA